MAKVQDIDCVCFFSNAVEDQVGSLEYELANGFAHPIGGVGIDRIAGWKNRQVVDGGAKPGFPLQGVIDRVLRNVKRLSANQLLNNWRENGPVFLHRRLLWRGRRLARPFM